MIITDTPLQEQSTIIQVVDGDIISKDQIRDYKYRGDKLSDLSFMDFILNTYDGRPVQENNSSTGRLPNTRVEYKAGARKGKTVRIVRSEGHETLPRFIGSWFPRDNSENPVDKELYCASMLLLLEPWNTITDLKREGEDFTTAFDRMVARGDRWVHTVLHNIRYYYECADGAKARREEERRNGTLIPTATEINIAEESMRIHSEEGLDDMEMAEMAQIREESITEEMIDRARQNKRGDRERWFGTVAINHVYDHGVFDKQSVEREWKQCADIITDNDMHKVITWEKQLKDMTRNTTTRTLETEFTTVPSILEKDGR